MKNKNYLNIGKKTNISFNIILTLITISCILPLLFVIVISFTNEEDIVRYGYSLFPKNFSFKAYEVLFGSGSSLVITYVNTILVTFLGTVLGLIITTAYAYALSRPDFKYRKIFSIIIFIPMIFSGGLVATYMVMTRVLFLKDSLLSLIIPLLGNTFYIIVMKTFFQTSIPNSLIEAARVDGANEFIIFFKVVLPMALPGIATIGLFYTLAYWNDWFQAMLYIESDSKLTLQYFLIRIQNSTDFLASRASAIGGATASEAFSKLPKETIKMAIVVVSTLPIAMAYPFFQKYFVKGLTLGAVKE